MKRKNSSTHGDRISIRARAAIIVTALSLVLLGAMPASADLVASTTRTSTPEAASMHLGATLEQLGLTRVTPMASGSTGQYTAVCINLGRGYTWSPNNVPNCPGYLYIYISGNQVAKLNTGGGSTHSWQCDVKLGSQIVSVFVPGGRVVGWFVKGLLKGIGFSASFGCTKF